MARKWYVAPSLVQLRNEINERWPNRSTRSDGSIGDAAHSSRSSQHNPNTRGAVNALDITASGIDAALLISILKNDWRVWYVIHNRVIYSRKDDFKAVRYTGPNPHTQHVHVSLRTGSTYENSTGSWGIKAFPTLPEAPPISSDARPFSAQQVIDAAESSPNRYSGNTTTVQDYLNRRYLDHGQGRQEPDGYFGETSKRIYRGWQEYLGYTGADADGIPGIASLQQLLSPDYKVI